MNQIGAREKEPKKKKRRRMSLLVERYFRPKMCAGTFYGFCKFSRISAMGSVSAEREAIQQYIRIYYMVMDYTMQGMCLYIYMLSNAGIC